MELKLGIVISLIKGQQGSNRTFMELKFYFICYFACFAVF